MAQRTAIAFSMPFAVRGLALAEQRLAYLTELYDSGRWRRFHDETDFLFNIREAKAAVASWQQLVTVPPEAEAARGATPRDATAGAAGHGPAAVSSAAVTDATAGAASEAAASPIEPLQPHRWRQRTAGLLPLVGFSANGVGAEADLRKAG